MAETIASIQARLKAMVTDWQTDNSHPANYVKLDGMNTELARVDRWCGGYQDTHEPVTIGWRAQVGNQLMSGVVLVEYSDPSMATKKEDIERAINKAKVAASKALVQLGMR
jgi:hypothetical protein